MRRTEFLTRRVSRLADTLTTLKEHVRAAVATELAQAIGRAVQDILAEFAQAPIAEPRDREVERNSWDEDEDEDPPRPVEMPGPWPRSSNTKDRWHHAIIVGSGLTRWWLDRGGPAWIGGLLGLAAGVAAGYGGALCQSGIRVLILAAELIAHGQPHLFH